MAGSLRSPANARPASRLGPLTALRTRAPLLPPAAGLILGAVVDQHLAPIPATYLVVAVLVLLASVSGAMRRLGGPWLVLIAATSLGGLFHFNAVRKVPVHGIERYAVDRSTIARVRGTVVDEPRLLDPPETPFSRWTRGDYRTNFILRTDGIEGVSGWLPASGDLRVTVREAVLDLRAGERVEVHGTLYALSPPTNPGSFNWARRHRRNGIVAGMSTDHRESVTRLALGEPEPDLVDRFRTTVRAMLTDDLATAPTDETSLLEAMILGHRSRLAHRLDELFTRAGCIHFLAVSGVHVVIVMLFARMIGHVLMVRPATRVAMMMIALVAYALIAEPRPPILRATIIALIYCVACLIGRQRTCMNWIAASAIVISLLDPASVFDIGWQLSFIAVIGVSYLMPIIGSSPRDILAWAKHGRGLPPDLQTLADDLQKDRKRRTGWRNLAAVPRYFWSVLAVSLAAWIATAPLVAYHFQRIHPWGPINSMIVLLPVTIVMALGFSKVVIAGVAPGLAAYLAEPLNAVYSSLIALVDHLGDLPAASMQVAPPSIPIMLTYYAALAVICLRFHLRSLGTNHPNRDPRASRDHAEAVLPHPQASTNPPPGVPEARGVPRTSVPRPLEHLGSSGEGAESGRPHAPALVRATSESVQSSRVAKTMTVSGTDRPITSHPHPSTRSPDRPTLIALAVLTVTTTAWLWPRGGTGTLSITVLDVGAGTATVIEYPNGSVALYDAGAMGPYDVGAGVVVPFLRHRGIGRIDRIYLTHPNLDHFSGVPTIIDAVDTGPVVVTDRFDEHAPPDSPAGHLLAMLDRLGHPVEVLQGGERPSWGIDTTTSDPQGGWTWESGGVRVEQRWPLPGYTDLDANDTSLVLRLSYLGHAVLMTGDIEDRGQRALIDRYASAQPNPEPRASARAMRPKAEASAQLRVLESPRDEADESVEREQTDRSIEHDGIDEASNPLRCDVLFAPHHGSVRSSTADFFDATGAMYIIRSSHQRIADTDNGLIEIVKTRTLYNTADHGAITITIDRDGLSVAAMNE